MIALGLCLVAFAVTYAAGRRSLVSGLLCIATIGYLYGIVRANFPTTFSHFIFDAGVVALYLTQLWSPSTPWQEARLRALKGWLLVLCAWPVMLMFVPTQDPLIQLVGLRGSIFLLPFLLFGARLTSEQWRKVALGIAVLNTAVFGVAVAEFFIGVPRFFPRNAVTEIIYKSNDVLSTWDVYRIPGTFSSAHAYAGTMVITMPLLLGAWIREKTWGARRAILLVAILASIFGVLMTAVRSHLLVLVIGMLVFLLFAQMRPALRLTFVMALAGVGWVIAQEARFQRFMTLADTEQVSGRIAGSVNSSLMGAIVQYPLGNGLGGGGTSMPYFLAQRLRHPVVIENEYGRIILEQGLPGLAIWLAFIVWLLTRFSSPKHDTWRAGRRIAWVTTAAYFGTGMLGLGLLTSIPFSAMLLLYGGWLAAPPQLPLRPTRAIAGRPLSSLVASETG